MLWKIHSFLNRCSSFVGDSKVLWGRCHNAETTQRKQTAISTHRANSLKPAFYPVAQRCHAYWFYLKLQSQTKPAGKAFTYAFFRSGYFYVPWLPASSVFLFLFFYCQSKVLEELALALLILFSGVSILLSVFSCFPVLMEDVYTIYSLQIGHDVETFI